MLHQRGYGVERDDGRAKQLWKSCSARSTRNGSTVCMVPHDSRYAQHADPEVALFDGRVGAPVAV